MIVRPAPHFFALWCKEVRGRFVFTLGVVHHGRMAGMRHEIELEGVRVAYELKFSTRARGIRLTVHPDGSVMVSAPTGTRHVAVERMLREKSSWILGALERTKKHAGKVFLKSGKRELAKHKEEALRLVEERLAHLNAAYGFAYKKVSIRASRTRWGSCSRTGNLNFHFHIVHLPPHLADYLVVHELCHLGAFDHSKKFWELVAKAVPEYKEYRKELKRGFVFLRG